MRSALQVTMTRHGPRLTKTVPIKRNDSTKKNSGVLSGDDKTSKMNFDRKPDSPLKSKPFSSMPGPKGLPLIGTLHHYFKKDGIKFDRLFEVQCQRAAQFGDIYVENLAGLRMVMISCPYEYSKVIRTEAKQPKKFMLDPLIHYKTRKGIKHGIITSDGDEWYKQRSLISKKMLVLSEVSKFADRMGQVSDDFVKRLDSINREKGEVSDLYGEVSLWAIESLGVFLFNERLGCLSDSPPPTAVAIRNHLHAMVTVLQQLMYGLPLYKMYKTKEYSEFEKHSDVVFKFASTLIEKKLNQMQTDDDSQSDFLTFLLDSKKLTRDEIASVSVDILIGGVETTLTTVIWNLYALATNPRVQDEMYQRLQNAREKKESHLSSQDLTNEPYVRAVVKETFRAFPVICATSRFLSRDLELLGYNVPAGAHVQANLYGMYRDERFFDKPSEYFPERWINNSGHQITDPVIKSLPLLTWGHGPRLCVGRRIAELEMYITLSKVVQHFKMSYHHEPVGQTLTLILSPDRPIVIRFAPRK